MGKDKVDITRRTSANARQSTFSKRKKGLAKKVQELSVLCGAQALLLLFSPTGSPYLILGEDSQLGSTVRTLAKMNPRDRERRKKEILQALNKTCIKQGHQLNMNLLGSDCEVKAQEYRKQIMEVQAEIDEMNAKLSFWQNPDHEAEEQLNKMEEIILKSIERAEAQKANLVEALGKRSNAILEVGSSSNPRGRMGFDDSVNAPSVHELEQMNAHIFSGQESYREQRASGAMVAFTNADMNGNASAHKKNKFLDAEFSPGENAYASINKEKATGIDLNK